MSSMRSQRDRQHICTDTCKQSGVAPFSRHHKMPQAIPEQVEFRASCNFNWACRQGSGRRVLQGALQVHKVGQRGRLPSPRLLP